MDIKRTVQIDGDISELSDILTTLFPQYTFAVNLSTDGKLTILMEAEI